MPYFITYTVLGDLKEPDIKKIENMVNIVNSNYIWQAQNISLVSKFQKQFPKNLDKNAVLQGKTNVEDSMADISYIIEFWKNISIDFPNLEIILDYSEKIDSTLPQSIKSGVISPSNWTPIKKEITEITVELDPILWDWWIGQEESNDAQALNDILTLFIDNFYEESFKVFNPKKTLTLTTQIPQATLDKCSTYIKEYGLSTFINSSLAWARLEEEKLKAKFSGEIDKESSILK